MKRHTGIGGWRVWALLLVLAAPLGIASVARAQPSTDANVQTAIAGLDTLAQQYLSRTGIPGMAIAVVYKDQVAYIKGFGVREAGKEARVDPDTVFQLASVSKPIATTTVAALVGDGVLSWDDPIVTYDPGFQMDQPWVTDRVTPRDMFSHSSGLPDYAGDLLEDLEFSREQILYRLRYLDTGDHFRAQYAYTNFGFTEAGVAAAKAAGTTWESLIVERLFKPLGMTSSSPRSADFFAAQNRAAGHVLVDGSYVAKYRRDPDTEAPAGGVSSSVRDLSQWVRLQLGNGIVDGKQIVAAAALAETHRPHIVSSPAANPSVDRAGFYGLGWNVSYDGLGRVQLSHSGAFALGAGTAVYIVPSEQVGIIVLTNAAPIGVAEAVALSFLDEVADGKVERDWLGLLQPLFAQLGATAVPYHTDYSTPPAPAAPALPLSAYAGSYQNDFFGTIEIVEQGSGLAIVQGPKRITFPMRHYTRDTFVYQPVGESAGGPAGVTFMIGPDQKATSVWVENLDMHDQGTFTRVTPAR